jgi:hypothetical protein
MEMSGIKLRPLCPRIIYFLEHMETEWTLEPACHGGEKTAPAEVETQQ